MVRHPKNKEIIDIALNNTSSKKSKAIHSHIKKCNECYSKYKSVEFLYRKPDISSIDTTDKLDNRVMNSLHSLRSTEFPTQKKTFPFEQYMKPLFTAASILIILTGIFYYSNLKLANNLSPISIAVKNISGKVYADEQLIIKDIILNEKSVLKTDTHSSANIEYEDYFKTILSQRTILKIKNSIFLKNENRYKFDFNLVEGRIYSEFNHNKSVMEYSFLTPNAKIFSIGTKFILIAEKNKTILSLKEGNLKLKSLVSGKEIQAIEGMEYTITDTINSKKINNSIKNISDKNTNAKSVNNNNKRTEIRRDLRNKKREINRDIKRESARKMNRSRMQMNRRD